MSQVKVKINPKTSEVEYEIEGMSGVSCEDLTRELLSRHDVVEQQYTEEYFKQEELPDYIYAQMEEE